MDINKVDDSLAAAIFYIQSFSLIDFIITNYGSARFSKLCRNLKDGINFKSAFRKSYIGIFDDLFDLEKKWVSYMKNL